MSKRYAFSSGPLENEFDTYGSTIAKSVYIKVQNNRSHKSITARIRVFHLDGVKTLIALNQLTLNPQSYNVISVPLRNIDFQFEVQYDVNHRGALVSVFTKDASGNLVAAQRVLNSDFTPIRKLSAPISAQMG